ncbi:hypothetical protein JB92DRAFT_3085723 [Gautieria morchelliformis]|nr:hypothetical protein JB92DRAFT_3085723 [Gautieria morchelliformis]
MSQLVPPFTLETAQKKVKTAQALWNTRTPEKVVLAYTEDTVWRNRDHFLRGHEQVKQFLIKKWQKETRYKLRKELFAFMDNKIAVQFWYEYYDETRKAWYRCYGLEDWTFHSDGRMRKRQMSGNEIEVTEENRWFKDDFTMEDIDNVPIGEEHW